MNFEEWEKASSAELCLHVVKVEPRITKPRCRMCVWEAAQKEMQVPQGKGSLGKNKIYQLGKAEGRKELAREVLQETKFWQQKVTAEKCLNDTIARLEKEANKK